MLNRLEILTGVVVAFVLAVTVELRIDGAEVFTMILLVSAESGFSMGCCEITIGCGAGTFAVLMIGFICVDPTFIVGVADCCIVLLTAAAFIIFAISNRQFNIKSYQITIKMVNISLLDVDILDGELYLLYQIDIWFTQNHKILLTIMLNDVRPIFRDRLSNLNSCWS